MKTFPCVHTFIKYILFPHYLFPFDVLFPFVSWGLWSACPAVSNNGLQNRCKLLPKCAPASRMPRVRVHCSHSSHRSILPITQTSYLSHGNLLVHYYVSSGHTWCMPEYLISKAAHPKSNFGSTSELIICKSTDTHTQYIHTSPPHTHEWCNQISFKN